MWLKGSKDQYLLNVSRALYFNLKFLSPLGPYDDLENKRFLIYIDVIFHESVWPFHIQPAKSTKPNSFLTLVTFVFIQKVFTFILKFHQSSLIHL
ncbi:hypothetical protein CR513_21315, partial [Mucuna pruriens]